MPPNNDLSEATPLRTDYRLSDNLWARQGQVFLTGTQALVRLPLMQRQRDAARQWQTQGFVSGYRGSPLGMLDQAIWKLGADYAQHGVRFVPGVNEELAATQVLGTQRVESDPERTADAVFALWYGKGPGVDRAGDALKHGNAYGASPHGGVLVVAGDDHGCVSSSMPHQSDLLFQAFHMPVLSPASVAEYLEFGLYGWELSRFSGNWVGMTALSEVVESGATVNLDEIQSRVDAWLSAEQVQTASGYQPPADGLHYRWPDLPSLRLESRLADKLEAASAFAHFNSVDRWVVNPARAKVGIVTCGKAHYDLMEVLRRLSISPAMLAEAGVRVYKVGLSFPLESTRIKTFAKGLQEVLVIEEKADVVEQQMRRLFYNLGPDLRPVLVGKHDAAGKPLVSALGELRPSRLIQIVADWLVRHFPDHSGFGDCHQHVVDFVPAPVLSNLADSVKRVPYFCAGCPHNTSTRVPEGSHAKAGIGCHFMASWMDRSTEGVIQMGGEGVDWVSHSLFTRTPHVFQNLGDGTYYHSGYLAIRQAVAAKTTMTYKILFNDAVAMTGGQPVDGSISVDAIARQVESEGVTTVAVVSDAIAKYQAQKHRFPAGTSFHDRAELDAVQRRLRQMPGVTVLIYEQTCAAEKRRRRKKGSLLDPDQRLFINHAVCEGCGDCGVQSNCVAIQPLETPWGRKRRVDQSSCNKDYSCVNGFCPSFVGVRGARLRRKVGALQDVMQDFERHLADLPHPPAHTWAAPYDLLVTGVGGTGVVTVGAVVAMAAHLEGKSASVLDFMGFAQKGGAVLSFVRLADQAERLNQVRIDTQQADAVLACDLVVAAAPEALQTVRKHRTRLLVNTHPTPVAEWVSNPDANLRPDQLLAKLHFAAGPQQVETFDAQTLAESFLGDTLGANILALGYAWQRGLVPLTLAALQRAIELNGVAVSMNLLAFSLGRLAAARPALCRSLLDSPPTAPVEQTWGHWLDQAQAELRDYQNDAYAQRLMGLVAGAQAAEQRLGLALDGELSQTVARSAFKLMAYKDEYEVARLFSKPSFRQSLAQQFDGELKLDLYMAPPSLVRQRPGQPPRKIRLSAWWALPMLKLLARGKHLRGTVWDVFGYSAERRTERALVAHYFDLVPKLLAQLTPANQAKVLQILALPQSIRGFGHVKLRNLKLAQEREAQLLQTLTSST